MVSKATQVAVNATELALNSLSPDSTIVDRIKFKRYEGEQIVRAIENNNQEIKPKEAVNLIVNPQMMRRTKQRIIEKVQTNAPDSFVVFDWGTDLEVFDISGDTGNLLPDVIKSGFNPLKMFYNAGNNKNVIDPLNAITGKTFQTGLGDSLNGVAGFGRAFFNNLSYFDIIEMSRKYRQFKKLEQMFNLFDADRDILTMEFGPYVFRGYFMNFGFTIDANDAWHWKYDIQFIALSNLTEKIRRSDQDFNRDDHEMDS